MTLESLLWVVVWIVFYNEFRVPQQLDADAHPNLQDIDHQLAQARIHFPSTMESTQRLDGFQQFFPQIYRKHALSKTFALPSNFYDKI